MKWIPITEGICGGDIVECLVKLKSGKIVRLNYNYDDKFWYYPSIDETSTVIKRDVSDFDWSIFSDDEVVYEMLHNPTQLPEDLFV